MMFFRLLWYALTGRLVWIEHEAGTAERCRIKWALPGVVGIESAVTFGDQDTLFAIVPTSRIMGVREECVEYERSRLEAAWMSDTGFVIEVELEEDDYTEE